MRALRLPCRASTLLTFGITALLACCGDCDGGTEPAPDPGGFTIAVSPPSASLKPGESTSGSITAVRTGKFAGAISLRVDGAPSGVTATLSPASLAAGSTSAGLSVSVAAGTAPGAYGLTVVGSATGQTDRTAAFTLTVTDPGRFTLGVSPAALSVQQGKNGSVALTVTRTAPFADAVALVLEGAPTGVTGTFAPASVPPGATASVLSLVVAAGAAPGTYALTLRGTGAGVAAQTVTVTLTVTPDPGSFTIAVSPATRSIQQGRRDSATVTITRVAPFTGAVALAVTGAPAGVTASFAPTPIAAGSTTSVLTLEVGPGATPGTYQLAVQGSATGLAGQSAQLDLTITPDPGSFTVGVSPAADTLQQGQSGQFTVTLTRVAPFTGAVALSVTGHPAWVTWAFNPQSIAAGSTTSTLTVIAGAATTPGSYTLTVHATADGMPEATATIALTVTANPGSFGIALSASALTRAQGESGTVTVTLTRVAPFAGPVALNLEGIPGWGSYAFDPWTIPAGSTTSTLTVGAGAISPPGVYTLAIRGTATGMPDATATLTFTVTAAAGITVATTPISIRQGRIGTTPLTIGRIAPFSGAVTLAAENLPAGVSATFNPATVAAGATSSQLTFSVLATAPVGSHQVTIRATGTGVGATTAVQNLTISAPPAGNILLQFCDPAHQPLWVGYQDGTEQWTQVAGTGGDYHIPIPSSKGGIAFVNPAMLDGGAGFSVVLFLGTREDLIEAGNQSCSVSQPSKQLTGTVAGIGPSDEVVVAVGSGWGEVLTGAGPNYTIYDASVGTRDLFAGRVTYTSPEPLPTLILRRNTNYPAGGTIPVLDFASAEAFTPTTQTVTTGNLGSDQLYLEQSYVTANGTVGYIPLRTIPASGTYMVLPPALTQQGEVYGLSLDARPSYNSPIRRVVIGTFTAATAQAFTLGPVMNEPTTFTLQAAPFYQVRIRVTLPAAYDRSMLGEYEQATRHGLVYATTGYLGGLTADLTTPDLTRVPGWQATWGPLPGVQTRRILTGYGWTGSSSTIFPGNLSSGAVIQPGIVLRWGSLRDQVVTPMR